MSKAPEEKRKHPRHLLRLPARIGTEERMYDAMAADFSEGGLQVETSGPFNVGAVVTVHVHFPSTTIPLRARVVRHEPGEPFVGLILTQGGPTLMNAYERWAREFGRDREKATPPAAPEASPGPLPEPTKAVRRRLETARGNNFEVLIEPDGRVWRLAIFQSPRNPNTSEPLHETQYGDYASADQALREFLKEH
jgi:PilZ domain